MSRNLYFQNTLSGEAARALFFGWLDCRCGIRLLPWPEKRAFHIRRRFLETLEHRGKGDPGKGATGLGTAKVGRRSLCNMTMPLLYDHAAGVDGGASVDGQSRLPGLAPAPARQAGVEYDNTIN